MFLYISVIETHLHGGFEPLLRQLCPTFTDGGPFNISNKDLDFEERFSLLVDAEWNRRRNNKQKRLIKSAGFSAPSDLIEEIEYHADRKLNKAEITRFATCQFIDDHHHIILECTAGNGKTYIACALGNAACRKFRSVRYIRMSELLDELSVARSL